MIFKEYFRETNAFLRGKLGHRGQLLAARVNYWLLVVEGKERLPKKELLWQESKGYIFTLLNISCSNQLSC